MPLKIRPVRGDGQAADGDLFDVVVRDPATNLPLEDVSVRCRVVSKARARMLAQQYQERVPDPQTRTMVWRYKDQSAGADQATDALLAEAIVGWQGIIGADDRPLVCTPATIAALDDRVKAQLVIAIFGAEVVEDASFRESARLLSLVPDSGPDRPLLSTG